MSDWEALHEALELWAASQKCVRGHVHLIQEVAERLHAQRIRDSELIDKLAREKTLLIEEVQRLQAVLDQF